MKKLICAVLAAPAVFAAEISPPTDGLVYQLDAADFATMITNEYGQVTNWFNKINRNERFYSYESVTASDGVTYPSAPWYNPDAFGGRGGVEFGYPPGVKGDDCTAETFAKRICTRLHSSGSVSNKTIVLVLKPNYYNTSAMLRFYGQKNTGTGIVVTHSFGRWLFDSDRYFNGRVFSSRDWAQYSPKDTSVDWVCYPESGTYTIPAQMRAPFVLVQVRSWFNTVASTIGNHYQLEPNSCMRGVMGEMLVYNRELTYAEAMQVTDYLQEKWLGHGVAVWQGPSRGTVGYWDEPANWKGGRVPEETDHVLIRDATVSVSGRALADSLLLDDVELKLEPGADLVVSNIAAVSAYDLEMNGAKLTLLSKSRSRSQKTIALVPEGGEARLSGTNTIVTSRGMHVSLARTTVGGKLTKTGPATLFCTDDGQLDGAAVCLVAGELDLNGTTQKLHSATGQGAIVNSAADDALLSIEATGEAALEPAVGNGIDVVLAGGDITLSAMQPYTNATVLSAGAVSVATDVTPHSFSGLTLHLDASDASNVHTDALGRVEKWYSKAKVCQGGCPPQTQRFEGYCSVSTRFDWTDTATFSGPLHWPLYRAGSQSERPAVVFGRTPEGEFSNTHLVGEIPYSNQTVIAVVQVFDDTHWNYGSLYGVLYGTGDTAIRLNNYSKTHWLLFKDIARARINGNTVYDTSLESPGSVKTDDYGGKSEPQMLVFEWKTPFIERICIGRTSNGSYNRCLEGAVHEVIAYDRRLSDNELKALETSLMKKWNITTGAAKHTVSDTLPVDSPLTVTGDASLGFGGRDQTIASLTFDAGEGSRHPTLTIDGPLDISLTDLTLLPRGFKARSSTLISAPAGGLSGESFATVPLSGFGYKIRVTGTKVRLITPGFGIYIR